MEEYVNPQGTSNWLDAMLSTGTAGGMVTNSLSDDPYIRLRRKLAQDRTAYMQRKRAADDAVLPTVIQDYKQGIERTQALEARIDLALSTLGNQTPPAMQTPVVGQADQYAQALVGLIAPGALPEVQGYYQKQAAEKSAMDFENSLRAYGLTRETAKLGLQRLMNQLGVEQDRTDNLYRTKTQIGERQAQGDLEAEQFFAGQEREIDIAEIAAGQKAETTAINNEMRQLGFDLQQQRIDFEKWKAENISKPNTDSLIKQREAQVENAKRNIARLEAKDKQQLAIANGRLRAEFGRLSETQRRTIIAEKALGLTGYNAETGRFNAELRAWEGQMRALGLFDDKDSIWDMLGFENPNTPPMPQFPTAPTSRSPSRSGPAPLPGRLPSPNQVRPVTPNLGNIQVRPEKQQPSGALSRAMGKVKEKVDRATELRNKYKY